MPGRGMSFVLYVVVLVVSVTSVMMGIDWLSTPPPPLPKSVQTVSAPAKPAAPAPSKQVAVNKAAANKAVPVQVAGTTGKADAPAAVGSLTSALAQAKATGTTAGAAAPTVAAAASETAGSAPTSTATAGSDAQANAAESNSTAMANAADVRGAHADAAAPRCDVQACAAHYHSFSASDCTYQPFDGPRRLCTVGNPPKQASEPPADAQTSDAGKPPASCNYDACGAAYHSFDPATCTYQPYDGPRRLCEK